MDIAIISVSLFWLFTGIIVGWQIHKTFGAKTTVYVGIATTEWNLPESSRWHVIDDGGES
jgi:hypothetical protein